MDQALNQKIDAYIAQNKEQLLKDIAALVAVNSVEGTPEEGAPFGAGPRAALDKTLELAAGMGFATRNCENYIGYAELAGKDPEKYLATICHVDVVPEGNGWTQDPFQMEIRDGWMIGRGVADDKGPMVATLYALKFLKEEGVSLRYPIRALVGDNEETHMHDVDYYLANYPAPVFCFTPDAEFPVCNGEKGHFDGKVREAESRMNDMFNAFELAKTVGVSEEVLAKARKLHESAHINWEYWTAANGAYFHNHDMAVRSLAKSAKAASDATALLRKAIDEKAATKK